MGKRRLKGRGEIRRDREGSESARTEKTVRNANVKENGGARALDVAKGRKASRESEGGITRKGPASKRKGRLKNGRWTGGTFNK